VWSSTSELYAEEGMTLESDSFVDKAGEQIDAPSSLPAQIEAGRLKLSELQRDAAQVNKAMASKRAELESLKGEVRAARKKKAHSTLTLLRERDAALERMQILERQLTLYKEEATLPSARARKHDHFLERLKTRCGLTLQLEDLSVLENVSRERPALHCTRRGTPVKALPIEGQWVYALITSDEVGRPTLTAVYSADMLEVRDFFQTTARPQKIR